MSRRHAPVRALACLLSAAVLLSGSGRAQDTWRVSVDSSGVEGDGSSGTVSVSEDGRFVAFSSFATNLVPGDTNAKVDVFVHDRLTGATTRASLGPGGAEANSHCRYPSLSGDGRYVAFHGNASNLVAGDTNGWYDVFRHDLQTGLTVRVSVDSGGLQGDLDSDDPSISADGRFVAFHSRATNLVPGDTGGWEDVFVHDCQGGVTTRVSVDSTGGAANNNSLEGAISGDGQVVAFHSWATNLAPGDTNRTLDVFVHDRASGLTSRVSVATGGVEADGMSRSPAISGDGRFVAFESLATNLAPGDSGACTDVFVHDRATGITERVSAGFTGAEADGDSGACSISADGRFVAFDSLATNLVPGDTNDRRDVFVHDRATGRTTRVSVDSAGRQGQRSSDEPCLSRDGRFVGFDSLVAQLVPGDTNGAADAFVHGPHLTLEATPALAPPGTLLAFVTWRGLPAGIHWLVAVDVDGVPTFLRVSSGAFDGAGVWSLQGTVPPGLVGHGIRFAGLGLNPDGKAELSNGKRVDF